MLPKMDLTKVGFRNIKVPIPIDKVCNKGFRQSPRSRFAYCCDYL